MLTVLHPQIGANSVRPPGVHAAEGLAIRLSTAPKAPTRHISIGGISMPHPNSVRNGCFFTGPITLRHFPLQLLVMLFLSSMALSQTVTTLVPTSYVTTTGNASSQPVATSIDLLDESGTSSTFSKYVEFNTNLNSIYGGYQLFTLPTTIAPSSVTAIQVKANYQGPATATQTWTWQLFNWSTNSYVTVGTNAGAPGWGAWTILTFSATGTLANYIRTSDGQIKVQVSSNNASDAADIDYEAVVVTYSSGPPPLAVSTTSLPAGTVGTPYSATLAATGGTTPYTWAITAGSLPAGITLSSAGILNGTPTASGSFPITVQVTDSTAPTHQTASKALTLTIAAAPPPLTITTTSLPGGAVGTAYSATLAATGGTTPYTWSLTSGTLPAGVTLSSAGVFSGTPTASGSFPITVLVTDSTSPTHQTKSANFTIAIAPAALTITTLTLPNGTVGTTYNATFAATGGTTPYTWSLTSGTLPPGVTLNASGVLAGTPTGAGSFNITVLVTDSTTPTHQTKSGVFTITIAATTLAISTTSLPTGTVGAAYNTTLTATGGTTPYSWSLTAGTLPAGITLNSAGVLSGTPTVSGSFPITVLATDSTSPTHQTASANLALTVNPASGGTALYVAPAASGGSDSNPGTLALPWLTITHAIAAVTGPGVTINLRAGTYSERVVINKSGSAAGGNFTIQNYNGEAAVVDGTSVTIGNDGTYAYGLVDIQNQSYVTVSGLEIRNFKTTNDSVTPAGIHVQGSGTNIQLLNNHIHAIWNTGPSTKHDGSCTGSFPNAFGLIIAGTSGTASITNLTINGNELNDLRTGCSESMTVNGNAQNFTITNNLVHDNSNIGIAALGGEGVASGYTQYNGSPNDQARNGTISGNVVHGIHSGSLGASGVYGTACYCADGIYLDGSASIIVERNTVYDVDLGIEVTGEGAAQNTTNNIVRDNQFYSNYVVGISIGGQGTSGGSSNTKVVNNTMFKNGTVTSVALGEFATGTALTGANLFENNIVYAGPTGVVVSAVTTTGVTAGYNDYFGGTSPFTETNSFNADPLFVNTTTPDLHISSGSLAVNAGNNLGSSVVGTLDLAGNPRVQGANIDIGAYEQ
jgi:N-terminal glycosyl-hydrolase-114-associated domain/Putative Ig domain/Right handed beta helix region